MALGSFQLFQGGDRYLVAAELTAGIALLSYPPSHVGFASPKVSRTEDILIGARCLPSPPIGRMEANYAETPHQK